MNEIVRSNTNDVKRRGYRVLFSRKSELLEERPADRPIAVLMPAIVYANAHLDIALAILVIGAIPCGASRCWRISGRVRASVDGRPFLPASLRAEERDGHSRNQRRISASIDGNGVRRASEREHRDGTCRLAIVRVSGGCGACEKVEGRGRNRRKHIRRFAGDVVRHPAAHRKADRVDARGVDAGLRLDLGDEGLGKGHVVGGVAAGPHIPRRAHIRAVFSLRIGGDYALGVGDRLEGRSAFLPRVRAADGMEIHDQRHRSRAFVCRGNVQDIGAAQGAHLHRLSRITRLQHGRRTGNGSAASRAAGTASAGSSTSCIRAARCL